jgi:hypothetical protein
LTNSEKWTTLPQLIAPETFVSIDFQADRNASIPEKEFVEMWIKCAKKKLHTESEAYKFRI